MKVFQAAQYENGNIAKDNNSVRFYYHQQIDNWQNNYSKSIKYTATKLSVFGVILVHMFPTFCCIRTEYGDTEHLSVLSPIARKCEKNADQNNSDYGLFLRSDTKVMLSAPFCQVTLDKTLENSSNVNNELENERKDQF